MHETDELILHHLTILWKHITWHWPKRPKNWTPLFATLHDFLKYSPENKHDNGTSPFLNRRYIFIHGCVSIVMLVFGGYLFFFVEEGLWNQMHGVLILWSSIDFRPHPIDGRFPSPQSPRFPSTKRWKKRRRQKRWSNKKNAEFPRVFFFGAFEKKRVEEKKSAWLEINQGLEINKITTSLSWGEAQGLRFLFFVMKLKWPLVNWDTPPKINIEPENDDLEDDFPFQGCILRFHVNLEGCNPNKNQEFVFFFALFSSKHLLRRYDWSPKIFSRPGYPRESLNFFHAVDLPGTNLNPRFFLLSFSWLKWMAWLFFSLWILGFFVDSCAHCFGDWCCFEDLGDLESEHINLGQICLSQKRHPLEQMLWAHIMEREISSRKRSHIPYQSAPLKMISLFPRWDMLAPWRVLKTGLFGLIWFWRLTWLCVTVWWTRFLFLLNRISQIWDNNLAGP